MNIEHDDLPVLTEVLRAGNGRPPSRFDDDEPRDRNSTATSLNPRVDAPDRVDGDASWARALVIGTDPGVPDHDAVGGAIDRSPTHRPSPLDTAIGTAGSTGANQESSGPMTTVADPRRIDHRDHDVFLRTSPTDTAFAGTIDEPPLTVRDAAEGVDDGNGAASSVAVSSDVPLVFRDRPVPAARDHDAAFALQVRDSVLHELSARIDTELDARIAQSLHAELETALAHLQASLRVELAEALRDVVGHAVDDAVRRLRRAAPFEAGP